MKTIILRIDLDIFTKLQSALAVKGMAGTAYGLLDSFIFHLLQKLRDNEQEWTPQFRKDID
jgi:hypothetical protein